MSRSTVCGLVLLGFAAGEAGAATKVFAPVADARVESSAANTNFGTQTELRTDGSPIVRSYLRFDVSGLSGQVVRATLRLSARNTITSGVEVKRIASGAWGESTITYANAPAVGARVAGPIKTTDGHRVAIDATPLVAGEGAVDLALTTASTSTLRFPSREVAADAPQLVVQTVAPGDARIAAAGDIACDPGSSSFNSGLGTATACRQKFTSDLLAGANLNAVLPLGDLQYDNATLAKFQQSYDPSWGRVKPLTRPVPGNHEYRVSGAPGYFDYFNGVGILTGPAGSRSSGYYSYELGDWHMVALNSNCSAIGGCGIGSPQQQWLQADLAAHPDSCVLAYWHHPRFSSGSNHGSDPITAPLWSTLYAAGADIVLVGHEHNYERFSRQSPSAAPDPAGGIRQFVVGTGGKSRYGISTVLRNSGARDTRTFGVLELILTPGGYDWRFVPEATGSYVDVGSDVCAGTTPDAEPPGKPASLAATYTGSGVNLTWSATIDNDGVAGYRILRNGQQIATSNTAGYFDAGAQAGGNVYEYRVVALDSLSNASVPSNPVTVTTPGGLSFTAVDDASIYSGSPTTNLGSSALLEVDASPREEFLMKFEVSGIGSRTVADAKLRLNNANASPFGGELHPVADDSWQEETVTWASAPAAASTVVGSLGAVSAGNWYEFDVDSQVTGDGVYSFRVVSPNTDGADYRSRQGLAGLGPQIVVTLAP